MHVHINLHDLYDKAYNWLLSNGPRIVLGIIILVLGFWLIRFVKKWLNRSLSKKGIHSSLAPFIQSLVITALQVLLVLFVMQIVGIQMTLFAAGIASLGVAVGLALSGTLQNFAGGVLILMLKPFKVGDNIVAQGQDGIVASIQIFYTVVTTFDNKTVIIPNSKLSNEVIVNISQKGNRRLDILTKFPYTQDPVKIQEVIKQTVESSDQIVKDPAPNIGVASLDPDGFVIITEVWVNALAFYEIRNTVQQQILMNLKAQVLK